MQRIEELTTKWLSDIRNDQESAELQRLISEDPAAKDIFVQMCDVQAALLAHAEGFDVSGLAMARIDDEFPDSNLFDDETATIEQRVEIVVPRRRVPNRNGWRRLVMLAMCLTLLVGAGIGLGVYLQQPLKMADATIGHTDQNVMIARNGHEITAEAGLPLKTGDVITVPTDAVAAIHYVDGTRVIFGPESIVRLDQLTRWNSASKNLMLTQEALTAHVAKQPFGKSLLVATATAMFKVMGTRFTLTADATTSRLDVIEGRVELHRKDDAATVDVGQGQFAIAGPDTSSRVESVEPRVADGLISLYRFDENDGAIVHDVSGVGSPLELRIKKTDSVQWLSGGGLALHDSTLIASDQPADKIIKACRQTNELTVEAWVRPTIASQSGPARIATLSHDTSNRNFTLGHGGDPAELPNESHLSSFIGRIRTEKKNRNGIPDLPSRNHSVAADLTHVVYTRSNDGWHRLHIDGIERASEKRPGDYSSWSNDYRLGLGNEFTHDRPWHGEFFLVAVFSRALSKQEVLTNFRAGNTK